MLIVFFLNYSIIFFVIYVFMYMYVNDDLVFLSSYFERFYWVYVVLVWCFLIIVYIVLWINKVVYGE